MDKKNTLLLTVIAVATLLVAVVGATFAYFSVVGDNKTSTTTVTGSTPDVGTVTLSTTKSTLTLNLTAEQMSAENKTNKYYAQKDSTEASEAESTENDDNHLIDIANISVSGGADNVDYYCTANLTVTVEGGMAEKLTANDAFIKLAADRSTGLTGTSDKFKDAVALSTIYSDGSDTYKDIHIAFSLKSVKEPLEMEDTSKANLKAAVWFVNTNDIQNTGDNDISNSSVNVKIDIKDFDCDLSPNA